MGSGCCSVDRVVASYTIGLQFESSHQQNVILNILLLSTVEKTKIKKKEAVNGTFKKRYNKVSVHWKDFKTNIGNPFRLWALSKLLLSLQRSRPTTTTTSKCEKSLFCFQGIPNVLKHPFSHLPSCRPLSSKAASTWAATRMRKRPDSWSASICIERQ